MTQRDPKFDDFFKKVSRSLYWVPNPLDWSIGELGLRKATEMQRPGIFNLAWLVLDCDRPPASLLTYQAADLKWAFMDGPRVMVEGASVEAWAGVAPLIEFRKMLRRQLAIDPAAAFAGKPVATLEAMASRGIKRTT